MSDGLTRNVIIGMQGARAANALILVTLSVICVGLHRGQVYVDTSATDHVCTDVDTPTDCWTHGGIFRAMNFTVPTTMMSFSVSGGSFASDHGIYIPSSVNYIAHYEGNVHPHNQTACEVSFAADSQERAACYLEHVPWIHEADNRATYRSSPFLTGGVHVWYMSWLSLWLSASFAVAMIPSVFYGVEIDWVKLPVLALWHVIGVVLSVMFYVDDGYFNMRLPLNNVLIGCFTTLFAILVQFYWARVSQDFNDYKGHRGSQDLRAANPKGISALMTIAHPHSAATTVLAARNDNAASEVKMEYSMEIFTAAYKEGTLMETFFMELAICLPPGLIAVWCMAVRYGIDWAVQSLYVRSFFIFFFIACTYKAMPVLRYEKGSTALSKNELALVLVVTVTTIFYFAYFFLADWIIPVIHMKNAYEGIYSGQAVSVAYTFFAFTLAFVIAYSLALLIYYVIAFVQSETNYKFATSEFQYYVWAISQLLMLVLRILLFVYAIAPHLWYGLYDKTHVELNYP